MSTASGGNSEPKQGQRSQSARGFCPRSTMRVPQPDTIEHFGNADAVPQLPERCLSRKAGIVRYCLKNNAGVRVVQAHSNRPTIPIGDFSLLIIPLPLYLPIKNAPSPIFFEPSAAKAIHLHYSLLFILYYLFFFNFPALTTVNTFPSTLNFTSTPPKLRPYRRSGSCW